MNTLLHPTYFPNIASFVVMVKRSNLWFEAEDNYQKQTFRNRTYVYAANGVLPLNIPVKHTQKERQKYRDVKMANVEKWQDLHWKSILSAYRTSPFFEYYEDELVPLFEVKKDFLFDFNLQCIQTICDCIELNLDYKTTTEFTKDFSGNDYRHLVNAKKETEFSCSKYTQVFHDKHGFINNLSILDLLFNEGPNTLSYLESQTL